MAELDQVLDRMDRINTELRTAVRGTESTRARDLVALRGQFTSETVNLVREINGDARLRANQQLAEELSGRLFAIRQALGLHQAKWRAVNIEDNFETYLAASDEINNSIADYLRWAKGAVRAA